MCTLRCAVRSLAICIFALGLAVASATAGTRPYTIDDLLKLEDTGKGAADPTGRWIVWEWAPPYDTQPDYSVNNNGTWIGAYQLMVADTKAADAKRQAALCARSGTAILARQFLAGRKPSRILHGEARIVRHGQRQPADTAGSLL